MGTVYSKEPERKFDVIHHHLMQILPMLQKEAETGRWWKITADNFTIKRDKTQAYIVLTYHEAGLYEMTFKVGFNDNDFDPEVSGEWFTCEYHFNITSQDDEIKDYYLSEQQEYCKTASAILDEISYNSIFAYGEDLTALTLIVSREFAFQKYCLMLDIMTPLLFRHETSKPLITGEMLKQKAKLETMFNTEMELVDDQEYKYIFASGKFLSENGSSPHCAVNPGASGGGESLGLDLHVWLKV